MSGIATRPSVRQGYRVWFLIDGIVTGANAAAYLLLSQPLPGLLGSTPALYLTAGVVLAVVTVGLLTVTWSTGRLVDLAWILVAVNVAWAVASFVAAIANPFALTPVGVAWVVVQGVVVLAFGILQGWSLRAHGKHGHPRDLPGRAMIGISAGRYETA